jgi:hypothetical protein
MVKKKNMSSCKGPGIAGHLFALAGIYVLTWGLIGSSSLGAVLKDPIFWGLFLLGMSACSMSAAHKESCKA